MWPLNKKEKLTIEIDANVYRDFCVKCAQKNVNDVIVELVKNYLGSNQKVNSVQKVDSKVCSDLEWKYTGDRKKDYRSYLTKIARKSNGEHYSENVSQSYSASVSTVGKYLEKDLWEMNFLTISEALADLMNDEEFIQRDIKSQRSLSNGVKRYKEFLEYTEQHS